MNNQSFSQSPTWEEVASALPHKATDTDRLIASVFYRFRYEGAETTDVYILVNNYFRRARWPRPSNLSATANHAASKGFLSEAGESNGRKLWRITRKGFDYIATHYNQQLDHEGEK